MTGNFRNGPLVYFEHQFQHFNPFHHPLGIGIVDDELLRFGLIGQIKDPGNQRFDFSAANCRRKQNSRCSVSCGFWRDMGKSKKYSRKQSADRMDLTDCFFVYGFVRDQSWV